MVAIVTNTLETVEKIVEQIAMTPTLVNNNQLYSSKPHLFDPTSDRFNFNLWSQAVRQQMLSALQNKTVAHPADKMS